LQLIASLVALEKTEAAETALKELVLNVPDFSNKDLLLASTVQEKYLLALERAGWSDP
jgi:hypothetical protein